MMCRVLLAVEVGWLSAEWNGGDNDKGQALGGGSGKEFLVLRALH